MKDREHSAEKTAALLADLGELLNQRTDRLIDTALAAHCRAFSDLAQAWATIGQANADAIGKGPGSMRNRTQGPVQKLLQDIGRVSVEFRKDVLPLLYARWEEHLLPFSDLSKDASTIWPEEHPVYLDPVCLTIQPEDNQAVRRRKKILQLRQALSRSTLRIKQPASEWLWYRLESYYLAQVHNIFQGIAISGYEWLERSAELCWEMVNLLGQSPLPAPDVIQEKLRHAFLKQKQWVDEIQPYFQEKFEALNIGFIKLLEMDLQFPALDQWLDSRSRRLPKFSEGIPPLARQWLRRQELFHIHLETDLLLAQTSPAMSGLHDRLARDLENRIFDPAIEAIGSLRKVVFAFQAKEEKIAFPEVPELPMGMATLIEEEIAEVAQPSLRSIPETVSLLSEESLADAKKGKGGEVKVLQAPLAEMVNYRLKTFLAAPLTREMEALYSRLKKDFLRIHDIGRLLSIDGQGIGLAEAQRTEIAERALALLTETESDLEDARQLIQEKVAECAQEMARGMTSKEVVRQAISLRRTISIEKRREGLIQYVQKVRQSAARSVNTLKKWAQPVPEDAFAPSLPEGRMDLGMRIRHVLEKRVPRPQVWGQLPFYYQQLFIGRQVAGRSRLRYRFTEQREAEDALRQHEQRLGGGVLIVGEYLSGKSHFAENFLYGHTHLRVFKVTADVPRDRCKKQAFTEAVLSAIGSSLPLDEAMKALPQDSALFFDDLELWWEARQGGDDALAELCRLIQVYGNRVWIMATCNPYFALQVSMALTQFAAAFPSVIRMRRLDVLQLKELVLSRHYSGGMSMVIDQIPEENLGPGVITRMFQRMLALSGGIPGLGLRIWLSNIQTVSEDKVFLSTLKWLDIPEIHQPDWVILIRQFLIHRELSQESLTRIFSLDPPESLQSMIDQLVWSGILVRITEKSLAINPWLANDLARQVMAGDRDAFSLPPKP